MTKEDIKKAFDICFSAQKSCNGCPLLGLEKQNGRGCKYNLFTSVINLITEQEKDIKQLKTECALLDDELRIARQETIDVLNELKNRLVVYYPSVISVIDEMIEEQLKK